MTTPHGYPRPEGPLILSQMEHPPVEDPLRRKQSRRVERGVPP